MRFILLLAHLRPFFRTISHDLTSETMNNDSASLCHQRSHNFTGPSIEESMILPEKNNQLSRLVVSLARFRGRIKNHIPGSKGLTSKVKYHKTYHVLGAISEETHEDSVCSDTSSDLHIVPNEFETIVRLMLSRCRSKSVGDATLNGLHDDEAL